MQEARFNILMVDDIAKYQTLYERAITDVMPATVEFATNGEEALDRISSATKYDLMILDLNMPKLGGEEVLKQIRKNPNLDNMPIIILTGDAHPETQRRLLDLGADEFIEKGSPPEIFVARLKTQMRHKLSMDRLTKIAVDMDVFAAGVLHDIRNLETSICAITELVKLNLEDDPEGNLKTILSDIDSLEDKAQSLGDYASDIINLVRETTRSIDLKPLELKPLIDWVIKVTAPVKTEKATFGVTWKSMGKLTPVLADKHFLQLALLNIIQNSIKYKTPDKDVQLVVTQTESTDPSSYVEGPSVITRIRDNGRGIKESELRTVFAPFVQGKEATRKTGFGLGLSMITKVVTSMNGQVWAEKPPEGDGTVICIELPTASQDGEVQNA